MPIKKRENLDIANITFKSFTYKSVRFHKNDALVC